MYSYLCSRKIKVLEIFNKANLGENHRMSREEFIMALRGVSASLLPKAGLRGEGIQAPSAVAPT